MTIEMIRKRQRSDDGTPYKKERKEEA